MSSVFILSGFEGYVMLRKTAKLNSAHHYQVAVMSNVSLAPACAYSSITHATHTAIRADFVVVVCDSILALDRVFELEKIDAIVRGYNSYLYRKLREQYTPGGMVYLVEGNEVHERPGGLDRALSMVPHASEEPRQKRRRIVQ